MSIQLLSIDRTGEWASPWSTSCCPDGHYGNRPPRLLPDGSSTVYADWLIKIFDEWFQEGDPSFHIRIFEKILDLIFGTVETTDYIGGDQNRILVIETDGGIEPLDVLKICGNNFTKLGYNVLSNTIDDVGMSPLIGIKCRQGLTI
jgi:uncharacterized protein